MKNNRLLIEVSAVLEKDPILQQRLQRSLDNIKLNLNPIGLKIDTTNLEAQIKEISSLLSKGMEIKPLDLTDTIGQIETLKKSIIEVNTLKEQTSKATLIKSGVEKPDISESVVKSESNVPKLTDDLGNLSKAKKEVTLASILMETALSTGVSLALDLVISGVMKLADELIVTKEELREFNEEVQANMKSNSDTISYLQNEGAAYDELSQKANLTAEEQKKLAEIKERIAQGLPELIQGYNAETGEIQLQSKTTAELMELLKEKNRLENAKLITKGSDALKIARDDLRDYDREIKKVQGELNKIDYGKTNQSQYGEDYVNKDNLSYLNAELDELNKKKEQGANGIIRNKSKAESGYARIFSIRTSYCKST